MNIDASKLPVEFFHPTELEKRLQRRIEENREEDKGAIERLANEWYKLTPEQQNTVRNSGSVISRVIKWLKFEFTGT